MPTISFDAIVIGAGPAGEVCAGALADGGLRVAIVERERVGGECSYFACIPSKTLLRPGEAMAAARDVPGVPTGPVDPAAVFAWRDFMVSGLDDTGAAAWLDGKDITLFRGDARLAGPGELRVGATVLRASDIVLATGSDPVVPPIDGLAGLEGVWTNREATQMRAVPRRMLVLGGGPVGVELAQVVARLGGEVALVEGAAHVLAREAAPLGDAVGEVLRHDGVELHLGMHATRARRDGADFVLDFADGTSLRGDRLLLATGRRPRAQVTVDDRMSAGDGLWAIGDVTGTWPLTYVGKHEARIAAANILGGDRRVDYRAVPRVVFTDPQAAAVGEPEGAFTATVRLADVPKTATYTREYAEHPGFLTLVSDGTVLTGACALGPEAGEWLQQATLAIQARVPLPVLRDTIQPFPTFSEAFVDAIGELVDAATVSTGARATAASAAG